MLQFYPESPEQAVLIAQCASKVGFAGGVVVDYPNSTKAKKFYLCLSFERTYRLPTAKIEIDNDGDDEAGVMVEEGAVKVLSREAHGQKRREKGKRKVAFKSHEWIMQKKARHQKMGKEVKTDSKYTGRKRKGGF